MFEADSHLKLLPPSIFDIYKVFEHIDMLSICVVNLHTIAALNIVRTLHGGVYHIVHVVVLVNLVSAISSPNFDKYAKLKSRKSFIHAMETELNVPSVGKQK